MVDFDQYKAKIAFSGAKSDDFDKKTKPLSTFSIASF